MLQIQHLTLTHRQDGRTLLRDFNFVLRPGDRAVLIGEEGDGKSTLLRTIYDPALTADYMECTGAVVRGGLRLGYLPQELPESAKAQTVAAFCASDPDFYGYAPSEVREWAARVDLAPELMFADRPVGSLSGGEKVKLQIVCLLLRRPDVLLLDEPSGDLDLETLGWLERFLLECSRPVLYVSHDETLIERTANVVIHLEQLRRKTEPKATVARMPYREYAARRLAGMERQEQLFRRERRESARQQEKYRQIRDRVEHQQATVSRADPHGGQLLKKKMKAVKSMGRRFEREQENRTPEPESEDAILFRFPEDVSIPNGKTVLDFQLDALCAGGRTLARNIHLHVEGPEKLAIIGANGAGKTTLLRQIAAELATRNDIRCAYMPQDYDEGLNAGMTPVEYLAPTGDRAQITRVRTLLGSMRYTADEMEHPASELSGGQRAKLFFLKMMLDRCNVLVLDEPTRNFSPLSGPVIRVVLHDFGGTILSVSHDRRYIAEVCDRVCLLTGEGLTPVQNRDAGRLSEVTPK